MDDEVVRPFCKLLSIIYNIVVLFWPLDTNLGPYIVIRVSPLAFKQGANLSRILNLGFYFG